jgi:hypothetical protein
MYQLSTKDSNMKTLLVLSITFICVLKITAQDFAPVGAEWYYTENFFSSGDIDYFKIESINDTIIKNINCQKLIKHHNPGCTGRLGNEFVYSEDSVAYFYDKIIDEFQVLFNLKANKNDSWIIKNKRYEEIDTLTVSVDSIDFININSKKLKRLYVTYTSSYKDNGEIVNKYNSRIIETIGDIHYLFNIYPYWSSACDDNYSSGLRCYHDNDFVYETGIAESCDYTHEFTGIIDNMTHTKYSIYPNPASEQIKIDIDNNHEYRYILSDPLGKELQSKKFISSVGIELSGYSKGIYFISIKEFGQVVYTKKIVKY